MKRIMLIFTLLGLVGIANAQQQEQTASSKDDMKTIFNNQKYKIGWYVALESGYTQFDKRDAWLAGISGGMIINHNFVIGLRGAGWCNHSGMYFTNITDTAGVYLQGGYGGLLLEYKLMPKSVVHVVFPLLIGAGGASYVHEGPAYEKNGYHYNHDYTTIDNSAFFVVEPGVRAEVNILKFMRLDAGISYRYTSGLKLINTSSDLLNAFTGSVGLKFGKF